MLNTVKVRLGYILGHKMPKNADVICERCLKAFPHIFKTFSKHRGDKIFDYIFFFNQCTAEMVTSILLSTNQFATINGYEFFLTIL